MQIKNQINNENTEKLSPKPISINDIKRYFKIWIKKAIGIDTIPLPGKTTFRFWYPTRTKCGKYKH